MRNLLIVGLVAVCVIMGVAIFWVFSRPPIAGPSMPAGTGTAELETARKAFQDAEYQRAMRIADTLLKQDSNASAAAMIAAESATKLGQYERALDYYKLIDDRSPDAATARWAAGEILFHLGRLTPTFQALQQSLSLDSGMAYAHERMIDACNAVGRRRESLPHLMFMVTTNRIRPDYLMLMGNLDKDTGSVEALQGFQSRSPTDLLPNLGLARFAISDGEFERATRLLEELLEQQPSLLEAHVQLGFSLLEGENERLEQWNRNLPASAAENPDIWFIRGQSFRKRGQADAAVRCFAESILRDANHLRSHQALAQLLQLKGDTDQAKRFAEKSERLQQVNIALEQIYKSKTHTPLMEELATLTLGLGRVWECLGWCGYAQSIDPQLPWPQTIAQQATSRFQISANTPHTLPQFNLVRDSKLLKDFPLVELSQEPAPSSAEVESQIDASEEGLAFLDVSTKMGIAFQFDNNIAHKHEGRFIFETTGAGVGVLDYDRDGNQDLFFAQGGDFPPSKDSDSHQDKLFRADLADAQRFLDVSELARLGDWGFGQGVSIGDVNADGFDDIFVCNIGKNCLWINAGDGTFWNAMEMTQGDASWTSSAAIADLDLDGIPEVYQANYVAGPDVFTKMCTIGDKPRSCGPLVFSPTADHILTSNDRGEFVDRDLGESMTGNGLGVVAFRMQDADYPSVFVSVDQQANLLGTVVPAESADSGPFRLENEAIVRGVGYDTAGNAQACMGIAAGDANGDGAIDLFVTNFYLEYYTLYVQEFGLFRDATAAAGVIPATKPLLGFGTQFLDVQLDGKQDLVVLNGHIDDHTHIGVQEEMPAQLFLGDGQGRFELYSGAGEYFDRLTLGRALAKLDFDRNGLMDFVSTDLEKPASLMQNASTAKGTYIRLELVGTVSDRNAFFAEVTLSAAQGNYRQTMQLVAGGGYQSSNERALHFSIPSSVLESADNFEIEIRWPSGTLESHAGLQPAAEYLAIEQQGLHQLR
ncbi:MAG: FG-GAP-like repeat-containing protein [bacterium]|nr:FG-GAP-like repeat-containing protein [bacterium]